MRIGVLGGGQLGRMLALAGVPLGHEFVVLEPRARCSAGPVVRQIQAAYDDPVALAQLATEVDVVTYEFENVPEAALEVLDGRVPVRPGAAALAAASDRFAEKTLFRRLGIETAPFEVVDDQTGLERAAAEIGFPSVLKTRRFGYDGKGQRVLRSAQDVVGAFDALGGVPLILEGFVPFDRELSIVAVRGVDGRCVFYPLVENVHRHGILHMTTAPAPRTESLQPEAEQIAQRVLEELDYVGAVAVELFDEAGTLRANEMAPRVHNSGHWTIEGAEISQFENHVRAVVGAPLGSTSLRGASVMVNLIGRWPSPADVLAIDGAHLHLYGKTARAGRKVGHVTVRADDFETAQTRAAEVLALLEP